MPRKEYRKLLRAGGYAEELSRGAYMRWQIKKELITQVNWQFEALSQVRLQCVSWLAGQFMAPS